MARDDMNFAHLTQLMLLHYLAKVRTLKNVILQWDIVKVN